MAEGESDNEPSVLDNFTQAELSDLKEAFEIVDLENEGKITTKKLFRVMRTLGQNPTEAEVQDLINAVDDDGNGTIEFEEFAAMMSKKIQEKDTDDEIKTAFKAFDHSNKGFITAEDLAELVADMGIDLNEDEIYEMIRAVDGDGDGQVSLEDFLKLVK